MRLEDQSDEELIRRSREHAEQREPCLDVLYRRYYRKVSHWCLRLCHDVDTATDLAQEVFLRLHDRIDSFRGDSRFSTWLYTLSRRVAINHLQAGRRRHAEQLEEGALEQRPDPRPDAEELAERAQLGRRLREAMQRDLEPRESAVLYLHYVQGLTLPAITELLELDNKSGAKAYVVSGRRKLDRRFGRWLRAREATPGRRGESR